MYGLAMLWTFLKTANNFFKMKCRETLTSSFISQLFGLYVNLFIGFFQVLISRIRDFHSAVLLLYYYCYYYHHRKSAVNSQSNCTLKYNICCNPWTWTPSTRIKMEEYTAILLPNCCETFSWKHLNNSRTTENLLVSLAKWRQCLYAANVQYMFGYGRTNDIYNPCNIQSHQLYGHRSK